MTSPVRGTTSVVSGDCQAGGQAEQLNLSGPKAACTGKPRPNHQRTLQVLRSLTPEQKLRQVFELNERMLAVFRSGPRRRFPDLDDSALEDVLLQLRQRWHNGNY